MAIPSTKLIKEEHGIDDVELRCLRSAWPPDWHRSRVSRFIQAKAEREACYQRQEAELAAKRKGEPARDTTSLDSLKQMRQEDEEVYKSLRSICRGC